MTEVTLDLLGEMIKGMLTEQRALREEMAARFAAIDAQLSTLRSMVRRLEERFDEQAMATLDIARRLRTLESARDT